MVNDKITYITTLHTNKKLSLLNIKAEDIDILDIAKALVNIPLFSSSLDQFYSVGQYSLELCSIVSIEHKMTALLFKSWTAYMDNNTKFSLSKRGYKVAQILKGIKKSIEEKYSINFEDEYVKEIDKKLVEDKFVLLNNKKLFTNNGQDIVTEFNDTFILNQFFTNFQNQK